MYVLYVLLNSTYLLNYQLRSLMIQLAVEDVFCVTCNNAVVSQLQQQWRHLRTL